ncbi:SLC13 family permease [Dethiobacter alkaliphilus]|uniref:Sodium-dependent dicarboxylate transporter SdcS n=1 Tax=Dethiobacter alkaliphilus AHT 1 TaxID=555088 RepID=C0GFX2_DETAL|nr:DASS family sodium-coupled anion symporter [Dethiobacter alkaliphilus]EEG77661.1 anion transporter [Dethiobacter alkaliphilus AHT 1]
MDTNFHIDTRPLPVLFLLKYKAFLFLLVLGGVFLHLMSLQSPIDGLTQQGYFALVIFVLSVILWVTNVLPLAITSLLVMGLLSTYQVLDNDTIYSFFGDSAIFFILGAFMITAAVSSTGLSRRVAYVVLGRFGRTPFRIVLNVFLLAAVMSLVMPTHAVAALMYPLLMEIAKALNLKKGDRLGKFMFFALCWGAVIGGVATFLGGARNPLAVGMLQSRTGIEIGFTQWFVAVGPIALGMMLFAVVLLHRAAKLKKRTLDLSAVRQEISLLGKFSFNEAKAAVILIVTLYMWVFHGSTVGIANIALISAAMFFVLGAVTWEEMAQQINWGTVFMYGGAITLGKSLTGSGVLEWLLETHLVSLQLGPLFLLMLVAAASIILTEGISNAAVVGMLMPLVMEYSAVFGFDPRLSAYMVAVPSGLSFMFPMGTPANAIAYSSGFYTLRESAIYGLILNLAAWAIFVLMAALYWPLLGLQLV